MRRTTVPFFCSTHAWSFLRYGRQRVNSMPASLQYSSPLNASGAQPFMNTLSLSVSNPSKGNGSRLRTSPSTSVSSVCSRTSSGAHSVYPVAMSVSVSVCTKLPSAVGPLCATRSDSMNPGSGSFQSANVRTGTLRRTPAEGGARRRVLPPACPLTSRSARSMVAALIASKLPRTSGASRNVSTTLIQPGLEFRLGLVA